MRIHLLVFEEHELPADRVLPFKEVLSQSPLGLQFPEHLRPMFPQVVVYLPPKSVETLQIAPASLFIARHAVIPDTTSHPPYWLPPLEVQIYRAYRNHLADQ